MTLRSDFDCVRKERIESLNLEFEEYLHPPTGLRHIHLNATDTNNMFVALFKTPASNNTGVSHVLEHMVLCGSERFPVHDAFFAMTNRSLNTGMNAFATPDCSGFHFSTRHPADFDNLLQIYLDGLFFPLLDALTFAREGIRIEVNTDGNPSFNGVVFNEMKGALSDSNERMKMFVRARLFPDSRYTFNEGGDPLAMTELNIDQVRAYHRRYYNAANAIFITYGDHAAHEHQQQFMRHALNRLTANRKTNVHFSETTGVKQTEIRDITITANEETDGFIIAWRLGPAFDPATSLRARLLQQLLVDTRDSLSQKMLADRSIKIIPGDLSGCNDDCADIIFSLRFSLTRPEAIENPFVNVLETISAISDTTVSQHLIENSLNNIELEIKDLISTRESTGLKLIRRLTPALLFDADAVQFLKISDDLARLREYSKDRMFVPELIQRCLLENTNRICVTWNADRQAQTNKTKAVERRLTEIWNSTPLADKSQIKQTSDTLRQQSAADTGLLPILKFNQIQRKPEPEILEHEAFGTHSLYYSCPVHTSISHLSLALDLNGLSAEYMALLPLYVAWLENNTKNDPALNNTEFKLHAPCSDQPILLVTGKCLDKHTGSFLQQVLGLIYRANYPAVNPNTLIRDALQRRESNLQKQAHEYAMRLAASMLDTAANLDEQWNGVTAITILQHLQKSGRLSGGYLEQFLSTIIEHLAQASASVVYVGNELQLADVRQQVESLPKAIVQKKPKRDQVPNNKDETAWLFGTDVSYCAQAVSCAASSNPVEHASLYLLAALLETGFLRQAIRHQGGAYGCGARFDQTSGTLKLFSYRDPRLLETINDFNKAWQWFKTNEIRDHVEQAKLTALAAEERRVVNHTANVQHRFFNSLRKLPREFSDRIQDAIIELDVVTVRKNVNRLLKFENRRCVILTGFKNEKMLQENSYKIEHAEPL